MNIKSAGSVTIRIAVAIFLALTGVMYNFERTGAIFPANAEIFSFLLLGNENIFVALVDDVLWVAGTVDGGLNAEGVLLDGLSAARTKVLAGNKREKAKNKNNIREFIIVRNFIKKLHIKI
jgi:hypothetical protein